MRGGRQMRSIFGMPSDELAGDEKRRVPLLQEGMPSDDLAGDADASRAVTLTKEDKDMATKIILVLILLCSMIIPVGGFLRSKRKEGGFKAALACNVFFFFGTLLVADILMFGDVHAAGEAAGAVSNAESWRYIAAALSTGMSCIGAGIAVASAASAALGALSEDSSIMGKALIFVALAESIALYGLLISFSILG